jgi:hypothetical protein
MILCFELSMPNRSSWNGGWSGEGKAYNIVKSLTNSKKNKELCEEIIQKGSFYYNFGDGWGASVSVKQISSSEASKARRNSAGFCGYDWMVDSIIANKKIIS